MFPFDDVIILSSGYKHTSIYWRHLNAVGNEYSMLGSIAVVHIPCIETKLRWQTPSDRYRRDIDPMRKYTPQNMHTFSRCFFFIEYEGFLAGSYDFRYSDCFAGTRESLKLSQSKWNIHEGYGNIWTNHQIVQSMCVYFRTYHSCWPIKYQPLAHTDTHRHTHT